MHQPDRGFRLEGRQPAGSAGEKQTYGGTSGPSASASASARRSGTIRGRKRGSRWAAVNGAVSPVSTFGGQGLPPLPVVLDDDEDTREDTDQKEDGALGRPPARSRAHRSTRHTQTRLANGGGLAIGTQAQASTCTGPSCLAAGTRNASDEIAQGDVDAGHGRNENAGTVGGTGEGILARMNSYSGESVDLLHSSHDEPLSPESPVTQHDTAIGREFPAGTEPDVMGGPGGRIPRPSSMDSVRFVSISRSGGLLRLASLESTMGDSGDGEEAQV